MSKLSLLEQLHYEWLTSTAAWEKKQNEVNLIMQQCCIGKGRAPTLKNLNIVNALLMEMKSAHLQLDHFMRSQITAPTSTAKTTRDVIDSEDFIRAARITQG